ncbi:MAG: glycosyltransferase [Flavobacterium sp.]|nr:MAG: glycosyltransferase [Flavobacterium sp.]
MKLFSIITVNYNNATGLQKTMQSVFGQSFTDFEFIVIDGGSEDGSKLLLETNSSTITYWVSEKDTGIYNAMNKGIKASKGDYLFFLNSGDTLHDAFVLKNAAPYLKQSELIYGNLLIAEPARKWVKKYNEKLSLEYFTRDTLPHQGSFIHRALFERFGLYDETLKIVADWKFFLEAICKYNVRALYIDQVISSYDYTGISSRPEFYALQAHEKRTVLAKLFPLQIDSIYELHALRERKQYFDSFEKDLFVQKYFGLKLRWKALKKKILKRG